jgi:hypothetical protein
VNFRMDEIFAQTQDLVPVRRFVYSVMMWRTRPFIDAFEKKGHAFFCGQVGFYPVSGESAMIIKTQKDLMIADRMMSAMARAAKYEVRYDKVVKR